MKKLIYLFIFPLALMAKGNAHGLLIDDFEADQTLEVGGGNPPFAEDFASNPGGTLGLERDLRIGIGSPTAIGGLSTSSGGLEYAALAEATPAFIQYDGADGSSAIDSTGLGGIDFFADGSDQFEIELVSSDAIDFVITLWSNTGITSESVAFVTPTTGVPLVWEIAFSSFFTTNFLDITAIQIDLDPGGVSFTASLEIEEIRTGTSSSVPIPEPATYASLGAFLAAANCFSRKKKIRC